MTLGRRTNIQWEEVLQQHQIAVEEWSVGSIIRRKQRKDPGILFNGDVHTGSQALSHLIMQ